MNKYLKTIFLFFSAVFANLICFSSALALEVKDYPVINGIGLPAKPTFNEFVLYYFNIALFVGVLAAAIIITYAGIKYFFSRGEVGKTEASKRIIIRGLIGLLILFGSILILNAINSNISKTQISQIEVGKDLDGIVLTVTNADQSSEEKWLNQDLRLTEKPVTNIRWLSNEHDLPRIWVYPQADFKGAPVEVANGKSAAIGINQSITFEWRKSGVYIYDGQNYQLTHRALPLVLTNSVPALNLPVFTNTNYSIKFVQPEKVVDDPNVPSPPKYGAILFSGDDYRGKCSWVLNDIPNLNAPNGEENKPAVGNLSSIYIFRTDDLAAQEKVTFYNGTNCVSKAKFWDEAAKQFKPNTCDYNVYKKEGNVDQNCPDMPHEDQSILSVSIKQGTLLILRTKNGECQVIRKEGETECVNTVKYGYAYNPNEKDIRPFYFTLLPFASE
ncbi:MAG: pilin [Candidatus Pacebacteria bacterium]|nr:pilin [Candidatus Paceibacterota bacterium]